MIDLSRITMSAALSTTITVERVTGGHLNKSVYVADTPTRFTVQGVFAPDAIKEITPTPEGSRATGRIQFMCDQSIMLYTTHDDAAGNDISDKIILDPGETYEAAYRIISNNAAYGVRVVDAQRVGAV